ncbi:MAG: hypothetical protein KBB16_00965 [Candidatus Pacebacteria bacterium]|nr:hypothetical protein [Candidatus Paceibacterota bacterium]
MNPLQIVIFMLFILPALIIKESYRMVVKFIKKHNLWNELLYFIIFILIVLFVVLWMKGYR